MNRTVTAASRAVARRRAAASWRARTSADSGSALKAGEADIVAAGSIWQPPGVPSAHEGPSLAGWLAARALGPGVVAGAQGGVGGGALAGDLDLVFPGGVPGGRRARFGRGQGAGRHGARQAGDVGG